MATYHLQPLDGRQNSLARTVVDAVDLDAALASRDHGLIVGSLVAVYKEIRPGALVPMGTHEVPQPRGDNR